MSIDLLTFRYSLSNIVELVEVADRQFCTAVLVVLPAVQLTGCVQVGQTDALVEFRQVGLVDAGNGEPPDSHVVVLDEIGKDALSAFQLQFVGHQLRDDDFLLALLVAELRQLTGNHVLTDESRVELRSHALDGDAEEVGVGLQDALCHRIALHVLHSVDFP